MRARACVLVLDLDKDDDEEKSVKISVCLESHAARAPSMFDIALFAFRLFHHSHSVFQ